jgi:hypothetical protein
MFLAMTGVGHTVWFAWDASNTDGSSLNLGLARNTRKQKHALCARLFWLCSGGKGGSAPWPAVQLESGTSMEAGVLVRHSTQLR